MNSDVWVHEVAAEAGIGFSVMNSDVWVHRMVRSAP